MSSTTPDTTRLSATPAHVPAQIPFTARRQRPPPVASPPQLPPRITSILCCSAAGTQVQIQVQHQPPSPPQTSPSSSTTYPTAPQLTPRQQQIVEAVIAGDSNQNIADNLGLAQVTVKVHLANITKRFKQASPSAEDDTSGRNLVLRMCYVYGWLHWSPPWAPQRTLPTFVVTAAPTLPQTGTSYERLP